MILRPPRSTRTDTLLPYTTLFRSTLRPVWVEHPRRDEADRLDGRRILLQLGGHLFVFLLHFGRHRRARFVERRVEIGPRHGFGGKRLAPRHQPGTPHQILQIAARPAERRVGKEWVSTSKPRGSPYT